MPYYGDAAEVNSQKTQSDKLSQDNRSSELFVLVIAVKKKTSWKFYFACLVTTWDQSFLSDLYSEQVLC